MQALLLGLSNAFSVSTVVQMEAEVSVVGTADDISPVLRAPELFGPVGAPSGVLRETRQYSLATATLPIQAGRSWMTTLLTAANPSQQAFVRLPLLFQPSFVQHDFEVAESYQGYVPSSWLKLALPGGVLDLPITRTGSPPDSPDGGLAVIPVPLPFRPQPPALGPQAGFGAEFVVSPAMPSGSPDNIAAEIEAALRWTYRVALTTSVAAQDRLFFDAIYNGQSGRPRCAATAVRGAR